ncbi:MAG TPA: CPBP family glutamic-type intramembrane protease [Myxococcales bacterium]
MNRLRALLFAIGAAGFALSSPFLLRTMEEARLPFPPAALLALQLVQSLVLVAVAAWGGARLCGSVGLDAPWLRAIAEKRPGPPELAGMVIEALAAGSIAAVAARGIVPLSVWKPVEAGFWTRVSGAFYGGTVEEILLRWGLLTALMVLLRRAAGGAGFAGDGRSPQGAALAGGDGFWPANLGAALVFGALHLPVLRLSGTPATAAAVAAVIGGNGVLGMTFGWLYRRRGLEAAMLAHGAADVWLQGLLPALLA